MKKLLTLLFALFIILNNQAQMTVDLDWIKGIGSKNGANDNILSSHVDASGNLYLVGQVADTTDFDPSPSSFTLHASSNGFIAKYTPLGALIWAKVLIGPGVSGCKDIGTDGTGNVYVTGTFNSGFTNFDPGASNYTLSPNQNDMFFAKYDAAGVFQWAYKVGAVSSVVNAYTMKVQLNGDFFIGGGFTSLGLMDFNPVGPTYTVANNGSNDGFVAKYNSSGLLLWAFEIGGTSGDYVYSIDADASGNVYAAGSFQGTADFDPITTSIATSSGLQDMFLCKYSQSSSLVWKKTMGGTLGDQLFRAKLDNNGDVVVGGSFVSTDFDANPTSTYTLSKIGLGNSDMFIGKYNGATGNIMWGQNTGNLSVVLPNGLGFDQQNNIYITGQFDDVTDFDLSTSGSFSLTPITVSGTDVFLTKYNSAGSLLYANNLGGGTGAGNGGSRVFIDNLNRILLTGSQNSYLDLDFSVATNTVQTFGGTDIFFARYTQCISPETPTLAATSLSMCANGVATLSIASGNLNSATTWVWSSIACGSSTIATGPTATVSPLFLTDYYVRGEGGCPTPTGACAGATVFVTPTKDITGLVTTGAAVPVAGYVVLYRYEGPLTKWDSVTYQNINPVGNYTFNSVNSTSYILMALPTTSSLQTSYAPNATTWKGAAIFSHGCNNITTMNVDVIPITNLGGGPGELAGKIIEGIGYGTKGAIAPGSPIGGLSVKGGKNPGGNIVAQTRTNSSGEYTLSGLPITAAGESYFIFVDIPGLDTNGTYRRAVVTGSTQYTDLDFVVDAHYINPVVPNGLKEITIDNQLVNVYPNPAKDMIHVSVDVKANANIELQVIDVFGKVILTNAYEGVQTQFKTTLELGSLSKGIYFMKIKVNKEESRLKIILAE